MASPTQRSEASPARPGVEGVYRAGRAVLRLALGFYFRRIESFHPERVPAVGPVMLVANHPCSLVDSWVLALALHRKVSFVGTVQLFRWRPVAWLLARCGVIAVNRVADDPRGMRTVAETFEACYRVLEGGGVVALFPEGITHDDPQLKEVKSGAARMALELEHRHGGRLGLQVVPVGLTFSAKERYRSDVLAHFGKSLGAGAYLGEYATNRKRAIVALSQEMERRMQALIVHLPRLEQARVVEGVKRLYLDRLHAGNRVVLEPVTPRAEELLLTQAIARGTELYFRDHPEQAAVFAARLARYERLLGKLRLPSDVSARGPGGVPVGGRVLAQASGAALLFPVALFGWVHRFLPVTVIRWAQVRFAQPGKEKSHAAVVSVLAGAVVFSMCYLLYLSLCQAWLGMPWTLVYALVLPVSGLVAHYYLVNLHRLTTNLQAGAVMVRAPLATRRALQLRQELLAEIEAARPEIRAQLFGA